MIKRGSPYTRPNPWKKWPIYLPCFCGSGSKAKSCPCTHMMPKMITPQDELRAEEEMKEVLAYVRTLWMEKKVYVDKERSATMFRIFSERDGAHYNDREMEKQSKIIRDNKIDEELRKDFEARSISLDEGIINEAVRKESVRQGVIGVRGSDIGDREGSIRMASEDAFKSDPGES